MPHVFHTGGRKQCTMKPIHFNEPTEAQQSNLKNAQYSAIWIFCSNNCIYLCIVPYSVYGHCKSPLKYIVFLCNILEAIHRQQTPNCVGLLHREYNRLVQELRKDHMSSIIDVRICCQLGKLSFAKLKASQL